MAGEKFNYDYFERGPEVGISCYTKYRWLPEKTIPAAMAYVDYLGIGRDSSVLDFGCAKGFYVEALRMLSRDAWGCDISRYALTCAKEATKPFLLLCTEDAPVPFERTFDFVISKDVFEHVPEESALTILTALRKCRPKKFFVVVPLAENGIFLVPEDELDATHVTRKSREEWALLFESAGWQVVDFSYKVAGIKEHQQVYGRGVGFFTLV